MTCPHATLCTVYCNTCSNEDACLARHTTNKQTGTNTVTRNVISTVTSVVTSTVTSFVISTGTNTVTRNVTSTVTVVLLVCYTTNTVTHTVTNIVTITVTNIVTNIVINTVTNTVGLDYTSDVLTEEIPAALVKGVLANSVNCDMYIYIRRTAYWQMSALTSKSRAKSTLRRIWESYFELADSILLTLYCLIMTND